MDTDVLGQLIGLVKDWKTVGVLGSLVVVVNILTNLTKHKWIASRLKPAWRPWIAMALGLGGGLITALVSGQSIFGSLLAGAMAALGGVGLHETFSALKPSEKAKREAASVVANVLDGPEGEVKMKVEALKNDLDKLSALADKKERLAALAGLLNRLP